MYQLVLLTIFLFPAQSFEQHKGYNTLIHNIKSFPQLQNFVHKSPNTLARITESISKSTALRNLISARSRVESLDNHQSLADISSVSTNIPSNNTIKPEPSRTGSTVDISTQTYTAEISTKLTTVVTPSFIYKPVSEKCLDNIEGILQGLAQRQQWAIKLIDSIGKPPADILSGGLIWLGDYDECLSVRASVTVNQTYHSFGGQYCIASVPIDGFQSVMTPAVAINVGVCVPDTCSAIDTQNLMNSVLTAVSNNTLEVAMVTCQEPDKPYDTRAIIVLAVISIFILVMIAGTLYDIMIIQWPRWQRSSKQSEMNNDLVVKSSEKIPLIKETVVVHGDKEPGIAGKCLLAFSVYTNGSKILSTDQAAGSITALHGIRFLSMTWVILGHTYGFVVPYTDNLFTFMPRMFKRITFWAIGNALVSVDSFFTLSGILLAYLVLKELKNKNGKLNWGMFYFHRFWRLTPPYMLVLMVYVSLFPYAGSGPIWPKDGAEPNYCKSGWYYNLLYVNNFVTKPEDSCFGWAWYLANDMQFFVISPLILLPLFYFHLAGVGVILAFLVATWTATGVMATQWHAGMSAFNGGDGYMKLYVRPYFRMGPYLVGLYTGYLLYRTHCKCRINKFLNILGWLIAAVVACLVLYGQYDDVNGNPVTQEVASLYNAVHRTVWGACLCWVVFSCANGYGGYINTILSWKAFIPLSRLTYCGYLVHPFIIYYYQYTRQRPLHFTDLEMIYLFLGHLVVSFGVAFVASLAFESPMMGLEKVIFKRQEKKR